MNKIIEKPTFDQYLAEVNKFIEEEASKKNVERSYIRLFRPYNTNKINIMGSFKMAIEAEQGNGSSENDEPLVLSKNFGTDSKRSLGMVATEQFSNYCFLHSNKRKAFDSFEIFKEYINANYSNFVIDDNELKNVVSKMGSLARDKSKPRECSLYKIYLETSGGDISEGNMGSFKRVLQKSLYARCLMSAFYECGLTVHGREDQIKKLTSILEKDELINLVTEKDSLTIKGVPSANTFEEINKNTAPVFRFVIIDKKVTISEKTDDYELSYFFDSVLTFNVDKEKYSEFVEVLKNDEQVIVTDTKEGITVKYFPTKDTLDRFNFEEYDEDKLIIKFHKDKSTGVITVGEKGVSLHDIYDELYDKLNFYKSSAGALYSGVIPRLTQVNYREPSMDNATVEGLILQLGRTSYFTMRSMGRNVAKGHPYMESNMDFGAYEKSIRTVVNAVDEYEIIIQDEYYDKMKALDSKYINDKGNGQDRYYKKIEDDIKILNEYLTDSFAQHNMNISGNLITEDGICLYTLRGGDIEDSGDYYCSTNGGSEIYDSNVDFYRNSVEEDIPSIRYSSENVYFGQELTREAIAELGLIDDSHVWDFYGMTCMGQKKDGDKEHRMSFHFNVIGWRRCMDEFEHIVEQKKKSTENFESKALYGYKLNTYNSLGEKILDKLVNSIGPAIIDNKDTIVWFIIFIMSLIMTGDASSGIEEWLSRLFVVASVLMIVYKAYNYFKERKFKKSVDITINDKNILDVSGICSEMCRKLGIKEAIHMDNILRLLTLMRFTDHFED